MSLPKDHQLLEHLNFKLANWLVLAGSASAAARLQWQLANPAAAQRQLWRSLLQDNAQSAYGRQYGFASLRTIAEYQSAVPIVDYDDLQPWIERIMQGELGVLTVEPTLMLEKSAGSTAAAKYIPYTKRLLGEFQLATNAWLYDLLLKRPQLRACGAYWSISPVARLREYTAGGLPVGFVDDTEYFRPLQRWILRQLLLVPGEVAHLTGGMDRVRYVTLRLLLDSADLGLISVWNPSFLLLLLEAMVTWGDRLVHDLRDGTLNPPTPIEPNWQRVLTRRLRPQPRRAALLSSLLASGSPCDASQLWPRLTLISCWASASAALFVPQLPAWFPGVEIQGKGLLATEGVVSFPLLGQPGAVLALGSHFLEFLPVDHDGTDKHPLLAHELTTGQRYLVLLTTGGGLYRYCTHDLVEVVGQIKETPLIEFRGKADHISDLCGEKLASLHVERIVLAGLRYFELEPRFVLLAPELGAPPHYSLFLEENRAGADLLARLATHLEAKLRENPHYDYCRDLGQLG
ncbi:MAG: GH3 auxin-responsive promoter family protein, partial [Cyanobacteria bacterium NC_groundwater_1444_Ag_S-0.65um_54_12]|nr:GH3 auxin-responsive promoter family protein [Cyanobacteria bacterium NC_groundwater_1444_Ag_S-0.65um_54_12]